MPNLPLPPPLRRGPRTVRSPRKRPRRVPWEAERLVKRSARAGRRGDPAQLSRPCLPSPHPGGRGAGSPAGIGSRLGAPRLGMNDPGPPQPRGRALAAQPGPRNSPAPRGPPAPREPARPAPHSLPSRTCLGPRLPRCFSGATSRPSAPLRPHSPPSPAPSPPSANVSIGKPNYGAPGGPRSSG